MAIDVTPTCKIHKTDKEKDGYSYNLCEYIMFKQIKLKDLSLHLYLSFSDNKVRLRFSPRESGNRSIYWTNINERLLRYQHWDKEISPSVETRPDSLALEIIKKAYQDLPFLKEVEKVIVYSKGFDLFRLATALESSNFKNIRVREHQISHSFTKRIP